MILHRPYEVRLAAFAAVDAEVDEAEVARRELLCHQDAADLKPAATPNSAVEPPAERRRDGELQAPAADEMGGNSSAVSAASSSPSRSSSSGPHPPSWTKVIGQVSKGAWKTHPALSPTA